MGNDVGACGSRQETRWYADQEANGRTEERRGALSGRAGSCHGSYQEGWAVSTGRKEGKLICAVSTGRSRNRTGDQGRMAWTN